MLSCFTLPVTVKLEPLVKLDTDKGKYDTLKFTGSLAVVGHTRIISHYVRCYLNHLLRSRGYNVLYINMDNDFSNIIDYINFDALSTKDTVFIVDAVVHKEAETTNFLQKLTQKVIKPRKFAVVTTYCYPLFSRNLLPYKASKILHVNEDGWVNSYLSDSDLTFQAGRYYQSPEWMRHTKDYSRFY